MHTPSLNGVYAATPNTTQADFYPDTVRLSFDSVDHLPPSRWQPPTQALLQVGDEPPEFMPALTLGAAESAWADTVRVSF